MSVDPRIVMSAGAPATGLARRIAVNTLHAASGRFAAVLVWLLFAPAILHALGSEGFGVWALFFALTGQFAALDFGLVQGTLRHVAAARERGEHAEAGAFASLAVIGFLLLGALWLGLVLALQGPALHWLRIPAGLLPEARFAMVASAAVFAVSGLANVLIAIAQGYGRFDIANGVTLALTAQQALGIPFVLSRGWGLRGLVVNLGIGWLLGLALGLLTLPISAPGFRFRGPRQAHARWREAFAFGGPLQVTSVLGVVNQHLDKFLLSRFVALAAVTPYELGARVVGAAINFPQLLLLAVMPAAAGLHARGDEPRLRLLFDSGGRYVQLATAVTVAALLATADRLCRTWLGPGHGQAALVIRGLAVTWGVAMAAGMASSLARGIARTDLEAWFHVVATVVHVSLSLWLLPRIGLLGTVVAYFAGHLAGATVFLALFSRATGWPRWEAMVAPCIVPIGATVLGALAGLALDRALPTAHGGATGWVALIAVATLAAGGALAVVLATRYVRLADARTLFAGRV